MEKIIIHLLLCYDNNEKLKISQKIMNFSFYNIKFVFYFNLNNTFIIFVIFL